MHLSTPFKVASRFARWWLTPKPRVEYLLACVTFRCNSRCQMCNLWQNPHPGDELSVSDYQELSADPALDHLSELDLTGGETFLRTDLPDIIHAFTSTHDITHVNMPSNGFLTDRIVSTLREIREVYSGVLRVGLSIDGYQEVHEQVRRVPHAWHKAYQTWLELQRLMAQDPKFEASVYATVIGRVNIDQVPVLRAIFGDRFMFRLSCSNAYLSNSRRWIEHDPRIVDRWEQYARRFCHSQASEYLTGKIASYFRNGPYQFVKCRLAVDGHCFIWPNGDVYPCVESWENCLLGNVQEQSLHTILSSDRAEEAKRFIRGGGCSCIADCMFLRNLKVDPEFHWWLVKKRWHRWNGGSS